MAPSGFSIALPVQIVIGRVDENERGEGDADEGDQGRAKAKAAAHAAPYVSVRALAE
jgi:hypothetical protein